LTVLNLSIRSHTPLQPLPSFGSFASWRQVAIENGILPIVGVTGSRGKTTVIRLLDAIFTANGSSTAIRTSDSVEIRGKRQRGEIAPWTRALQELRQGSLDVAIQELDWLAIHTMGLERASQPIIVITNVCANRDACLIQGDAKRAIASLPIVFESVHDQGHLIINGDDYDISREELGHQKSALFVGFNKESPGLRDHLSRGGMAAWTEIGELISNLSANREPVAFGSAADLSFALAGHAGFQVQNALAAGAAALSAGIDPAVVRSALESFDTNAVWMPGSFQVIDVDGISVVVDRPNPSWFLRPVLRSLRDIAPNRIISVVGRLTGVPASDLPEVGRLVGRSSSLLVSHSVDEEPARAAAFKRGAAQNEVPAAIVHTRNESRALARALSIARRGDLVLVLADRPAPLIRTIARASRSNSNAALVTT